MSNIFLPPLRPPGALAEANFLRLCVHCGKCLEVCPHDSLFLDQGFGRGRHAPRLDPQQTPCYLCMKCPPACPTGALDPRIASMEQARMGRAYILMDRCHNYVDNTMCMTCYDRCPLRGRAIVLTNGLMPAITEDCAGCGVCAYVCPLDAVEIVPASSAHVPLKAAATQKKN